MIPFNFHHLYYFYVIAKVGTVSQAAKELHLSQPALSYQMKRLEDYFDVKFFERKGRKLILTKEGHAALSYAKQIFDIGKEFADGLHDRSKKGRLLIQIGVLNSIPKIFTNALLKFILSEDAAAQIQLREDSFPRMIEDLKDHLLDLVLADMPFQSSVEDKIESHLIAKIPVVFCANPRLAKQYQKLPRDLHHAPMIFPTSDSRVFFSVQDYLAGHKVIPRIVAEIQDVELAYQMAADGMGIIPLNLSMAESAPKDKLVILPHLRKCGIFESIYIITKKRNHSHPLVEKVMAGFRLPQ